MQRKSTFVISLYSSANYLIVQQHNIKGVYAVVIVRRKKQWKNTLKCVKYYNIKKYRILKLKRKIFLKTKLYL